MTLITAILRDYVARNAIYVGLARDGQEVSAPSYKRVELGPADWVSTERGVRSVHQFPPMADTAFDHVLVFNDRGTQLGSVPLAGLVGLPSGIVFEDILDLAAIDV